jgi:hypothetical protein
VTKPLVYLWTGALCICLLAGFVGAIAGYNVARSRDASANAVPIDMSDLISIGPQALPPSDGAFRLRVVEPSLVSRRNCLVERQWQNPASWRTRVSKPAATTANGRSSEEFFPTDCAK